MKTQKIPTLEQAFTGTLFGSATPQAGEAIVEMDPAELTEITDQPFHAYDSDKLSELAESIRENGQQQPCIVRKKDGKYIILSGRNRKRACERIGCKVKCIVRECTNAEADLILTDTNLYQRHELLPSELAHAYFLQKIAYEARGERRSTAAIADAYGKTVKSVQRYIELAKLPQELLDMIDAGRLPVMVGVEFSNMGKNDLDTLFLYLSDHQSLSVSVEQAKNLRRLSPITETELNHFFYPDEELSKISSSTTEKKDKTVISISLKTDYLKSIDNNFDYLHTPKDKIKLYVMDCLADYFKNKELTHREI